MSWSMTNFQQGGLIGWLLPNSQHGITEITRALDIVGVRMLAQNRYSTGYHAKGWDIDVQGGRGNDQLHDAVARYALTHWRRLGIRYMAWAGSEWVTDALGTRHERDQLKDYGGSDPWHRNHVHISFYPVEIIGRSGAEPTVAVGSAVGGGISPSSSTSAGTSTSSGTGDEVRDLQTILADLDHYRGEVDGTLGAVTRDAVRDYQRDNGLAVDGELTDATRTALRQDQTRLGRVEAIAVENQRRISEARNLARANAADMAWLKDRVMKTNAATGRLDRSVPVALARLASVEADLAWLKDRTMKTNAAAGRLDRWVPQLLGEVGALRAALDVLADARGLDPRALRSRIDERVDDALRSVLAGLADADDPADDDAGGHRSVRDGAGHGDRDGEDRGREVEVTEDDMDPATYVTTDPDA